MSKFKFSKQTVYKLLKSELWPLTCFKNASLGTPQQQLHAYKYNQENAFLLEIPILNWIIIALINFNLLVYLDSVPREIFINMLLSAMHGIAFALSVIIVLILTIMYTYLSYVDAKLYRDA